MRLWANYLRNVLFVNLISKTTDIVEFHTLGKYLDKSFVPGKKCCCNVSGDENVM